MVSGGGGGSEAEPITAINITPLVDVSLVLVIIFMVTMPYLMEKALNVNASQQKATATSSTDQPILVEIDNSGVQIEGRSVRINEIAPMLREIIKQRQNAAVAVSAQRQIPHGQVIAVLDQIANSGASSLDLLQPAESKL